MNNLSNALEFIALAQEKTGKPNETNCFIHNGFVTASNDFLTTSHLFENNIEACPKTIDFLNALKLCGKNFKITQLSLHKIAVQSGRLTAYIDCLENADALYITKPDQPRIELTEAFLNCLKLLSPLTDTKEQDIKTSSILLKSGTAVASKDQALLLEAYHGVHMPTIAVPSKAIKAVLKSKKTPSHLGFSDNSATFHFPDDSWIKTQFYEGDWPDTDSILNYPGNAMIEPPKGFFKALHKLKDFTDDFIIIEDDKIKTSAVDNKGTEIKFKGFDKVAKLNISYLLLIEKFVKTIDIKADDHHCYFYGDDVRGVLAGVNYG